MREGGGTVMSIKSNQLLKSIKQATKNDEQSTRMAKVTEISNNRVYLTFYGETQQSMKSYKAISTYVPTVGDTVIVQMVGSSFIILGKVE